MTAKQILAEIEPLGSEGYRKILRNHGIPDPMFGVKIEYLKKIQKRIKQDYRLALDLYDTGNYDARYLAGLITDDSKMTRKDLQHWLATANCGALRGTTVAWVAAGSPHGHEIALAWIDAQDAGHAEAGWSTLGGLVSIKDDSALNLAELKQLLQRVQKTIHQAPNHVRYNMNAFVIAAGTYVQPLTDLATQIGKKIGEVTVDMGETSCRVPYAPDYIEKARKRGVIGKKRKTVKC